MMIPKHGSLRCETYLNFVRRLPCVFCDSRGGSLPIAAHHFPLKGRGFVDDTNACSACAMCHKRAHGERVEGRDPIAKNDQEHAVLRTWRLFMEKATPVEWEAVSRARAKWYESQVFHNEVAS